MSRARKANATVAYDVSLQDTVIADLTNLTKTIEETDDRLGGKILKLLDWNEKADTNITRLLDRVSALEAAERERNTVSLEDLVKEKMDAFVSGELTRIVEGKVAQMLASGELTNKVSTIVKTLLGTQGKDGKIISVTQLRSRGNLNCLDDLVSDIGGHYQARIFL